MKKLILTTMTNNNFLLYIMSFLLFSCSETRIGDLFEIQVDINQNNLLSLSEIVEEFTVIEPELTDESLINPDMIERIIISENNVFVAQLTSLYVFTKDGKFVRTIGSRGQGPGEYNWILGVAMDEKNKRLFLCSNINKLICYDFNGNFIKESFQPAQLGYSNYYFDINYINDEILLDDFEIAPHYMRSALFRLNDEFRVIDSCITQVINLKTTSTVSSFPIKDFIFPGKTSVYWYKSESLPNNRYIPVETVLRDTLYRFEDNQLIPELKLTFRNDGKDRSGNLFIHLHTIYRSSRYVFARYENKSNNTIYDFCYDTKTGKSYNMPNGYTDDIHHIEKRFRIRPLSTNSEYFYFWHTHMNPDDREEPNPTIYIGKLKN